MVEKIFKQKLRSKAIWAILIIGSILVHVFPILTAALIPKKELTAELILNYLKGDIFFLFTLLLAAVVCSNLISQDIKDRSLVLYFSRPLKSDGYILGKLGGAFSMIAVYCLLPPLIVCTSIIATQTGDAYLESLKVLSRTVVAGCLISSFLLPYALLLSSLTKRRAYAGIGTFMSIYALNISSLFLVRFDHNWRLLNPTNLLNFTLEIIYGFGLPDKIDAGLYGVSFVLFISIPLALLFYRIHSKEVGR